jgi:ADP-ribosylglycohydrolase
MRSAPIGLVARDPNAAFRLARDAAVLTHGHPSGYLAAAYFAAVVQCVARDVTLVESMREADTLLERESGGEEVRRAVEVARVLVDEGTAPREAIAQLGRGWVAEEALAIALLCALTAEGGTPDAVRASLYRAVAHSGDSDSTGSLTGNLLGAMFGVEALPMAWLDDLELRDTIAHVARDLHATFVLGLEPDVLRYPPS